MTRIKIAPSLLAADFARLGEEIAALEAAGADYIHLDVMDGHFVPNMTIGPPVIKSLRGATGLPFDAHLMIAPADPFIEVFIDAGADIVTIHPEAGAHPHRTLGAIREAGAKAGLALNPGTPASALEPLIDMVDLVLVMTVNPGFGGQRFLTPQLRKIEKVRTLIEKSGAEISLEVDGGVDARTAPQVIAAGADILVAGTAVFKGPGDYRQNIDALRDAG